MALRMNRDKHRVAIRTALCTIALLEILQICCAFQSIHGSKTFLLVDTSTRPSEKLSSRRQLCPRRPSARKSYYSDQPEEEDPYYKSIRDVSRQRQKHTEESTELIDRNGRGDRPSPRSTNGRAPKTRRPLQQGYYVDPALNYNPSRATKRQRRNSTERSRTTGQIPRPGLSNSDPNEHNESRKSNWSSRNVRRIRRDAVGARQGSKFSRVIGKTSQKIAKMFPEELVDVGSKAARVAARTSKAAVNDLLEYIDEADGEEDEQARKEAKRARMRRRQRVQATILANSQSPYVTRLDDDYKESSKGDESENRVRDDNIQSRVGDTSRPIQEILDEVNALGISYDADTTREELEALLSVERNKRGSKQPSSDGGSVTRDPRQGSNQRGRQDQRRKKPKSSDTWDTTSRIASSAGARVASEIKDKSSKKIKKVRTTVSELFQRPANAEDSSTTDPVIVDAVIENFSKVEWDGETGDDIIDVDSKIPTEHRPTRKSGRAARSKARKISSIHDQVKANSPDAKSQDIGSWRSRYYDERISDEPETLGGDSLARDPESFMLPPANVYSRTRRGGRGRSLPTDKRRRIYSPRSRGPSRRQDPYGGDSLEELGDYVANSVDAFLWGDERKDEDVDPGSPRKSRRARQSSGRSGHWKDRMEEQFDAMMGIHENGKHYNRWLDSEMDDAEAKEGTDAVSYARGRAPRPGSRRRIFERPIWNEPDSILSQLFGTGGRDGFDDYRHSLSFVNSGSVVKVLRTLSKSAAIVGGGVSRWASVRGSIPQPLVVVGALSAALTSRPRSRIRNVILALLALRTVGELLHGYVYDDDDFWDDADDQDIDLEK